MTRIPWSGIYAIECLVNGRVYVGQARVLDERIAQHTNALAKGYAQNARIRPDLRKFGGEAFRIVVLERTPDPRQLDRLEAEWAERLGAHGPEGYNVQSTRKRQPRPHVYALALAHRGARDRIRNAQRHTPIATSPEITL